MKSRIARSRLLYLRRIETGNNEVLKRILEDSKKNKRSKWWETTRKYMNWAQIEEREIRESTAKKKNHRKNNKSSGGRMERRTREEELLRDIYKIQNRNERGGLQRKSIVNGVVESENKQPKSRRELLVKKQGDMCGMQ